MSGIDRGPLHRYEVTWANGHVEYVEAHQALMPAPPSIFGGDDRPPVWAFHGEINGRWRLVLSAPAAVISVVRDITLTERTEP